MTTSNHNDRIIISRRESSQKISIRFSVWKTFKGHLPRFILTVLVDIVLPLVIYFLLQKRLKPVYALFASGTAPFFMFLGKAIICRTFDALGFLVFFGFLMSALVTLLTHNPIFLLLEKSIVTAILSFVFGLTLIPFNCCRSRCRIRPLAYYFYRDLVPTRRIELGLPNAIFTEEKFHPDQINHKNLSDKEEVAQVYEWIYRHCSSFRSACYIITSVWSFGYFCEFFARVILILVQSNVNKIFIYGHIILTTITVVCILLTIGLIGRERRQTLKFIQLWNEENSTSNNN